MFLPLASLHAVILLLGLSALLGRLTKGAGDDDFRFDNDAYHSSYNLPSPSLMFFDAAEPSQVRSESEMGPFHAASTSSPVHEEPSHPVLEFLPGSSRLSDVPALLQASDVPQNHAFLPPRQAERTTVPQLRGEEPSEKEEYHIWRTLRYKLDRLRVNPRSLVEVKPLPGVRSNHLDLLRKELKSQLDTNMVFFVAPAPDHRARIFASPVASESFRRTIFGIEPIVPGPESDVAGLESVEKVVFAVFSVQPHPSPVVTWLTYYSLDVPYKWAFHRWIQGAKHVRTLRQYLHPVA